MTESVSGHNLNASVRYRGVDVGRVRAIALAPGNVEQVQVTLDIERGTPVKEDTVALLETQGLTGIAFVNLTAGHRDSPALKAKPGEPYPVIQSGISLMGRLESSVPVLLAGLNRVSDNLNAVLDEENRRALKHTLTDLQILSRTLAARSAAGASASGTLDSTRADLQRFTGETLPEMRELVAELRALAATLQRAGDKVERNPNVLLFGRSPSRPGPGE
jgi:phospholipid/cholesterol/gamma-HCH transport system substrate-binding protein